MEATVSLFDPATRDDPYPVYRFLRETAPVYREPEFGSFALTRFDDVYNALRDHDTFSSARGISPGMDGGAFPAVITSDPPKHTRMRSVVNRAFTPRVIAELEPWLKDVVDDLLSELPTEDIDIVSGLTTPLPVTAIAKLLGIPSEDNTKFKQWSDAVVGTTDMGIQADAGMMFMEMATYFGAKIAERSATPTTDLIGRIVSAEFDGERLTEAEMMAFCILLLIAGNETTTNLLSNMLALLSRRPDLWERLRADRGLVPGAIEELLRFDSPVQMLWRTTTRDIELRGVAIPENSKVLVGYAAANRDPEEFPDPDNYILDRDFSMHMAFGFGIHYCLGAPLARLEARVAINGLLDRYEAIAPGAGGRRRLGSAILRGYQNLHLDLTAAS